MFVLLQLQPLQFVQHVMLDIIAQMVLHAQLAQLQPWLHLLDV